MLGHCDIVWNEWADAAANLDGVECLRSSVPFSLKRRLREKVWLHDRWC